MEVCEKEPDSEQLSEFQMEQLRLLQREIEAVESAYSQISTKMESYGTCCKTDHRGELSLADEEHGYTSQSYPYDNDYDLDQIRDTSRWIAGNNPWGIAIVCGARDSIVGKGHDYTVVPKPRGMDEVEIPQSYRASAIRVEEFLDELFESNNWKFFQRDNAEALVKEGDEFIVKDQEDDGITLFTKLPAETFREPPSDVIREIFELENLGDPDEYDHSFGVIRGARNRVLGYWQEIDRTASEWEFFFADEIQHRKRNVDILAPRGMPKYWGVRRYLNYADVLMQNIMKTSSFQAAYALIRKVTSTKTDDIRKKLAGGSCGPEETFDVNSPNVVTSRGFDYEWMKDRATFADTIGSMKECLRAVAAAMCMAEFQLTGDASNSNLNSLKQSEGPSVRSYEAEQELMICEDMQLINEALDWAVESGVLRRVDINRTEIRVCPPRVETRDIQEEVFKDNFLFDKEVLSMMNLAGKWKLNYTDNQRQIAAEKAQGTRPEQPVNSNLANQNVPRAPSGRTDA